MVGISSEISGVFLSPCKQTLHKMGQNLDPFSAKGGTLWTDAGVDQNYQRDLGATGPYALQGKLVWTNPMEPCFQGKCVWTKDHESGMKKPKLQGLFILQLS